MDQLIIYIKFALLAFDFLELESIVKNHGNDDLKEFLLPVFEEIKENQLNPNRVSDKQDNQDILTVKEFFNENHKIGEDKKLHSHEKLISFAERYNDYVNQKLVEKISDEALYYIETSENRQYFEQELNHIKNKFSI